METSAVVFLAIVFAVIIGNTLFCFWKLLNSTRTLD